MASYKRAYKACISCRKRKARCLIEDDSTPNSACQRCKRENKECIMPENSTRGGIRHVLAGRAKRLRTDEASVEEPAVKDTAWSHRELYNQSDAINLLSTLAGIRTPNVNSGAHPILPIVEPIPLSQCALVTNGIMNETEVKSFVNFFMRYMLPFYPHIPPEYRTAESIAGMPFFVATICCLAARFFATAESMGAHVDDRKRKADIALQHSAEVVQPSLWEFCQARLGSTLLSEPSIASVGDILALLLMTEWSPSGMYASQKPGDAGRSQAARQTDRIHWLFVGHAIRLAQEIQVTQSSPQLFTALNFTEICISTRLGRESMVPDFIQKPLPEKLRLSKTEAARCELLKITGIAAQTLYPSRDLTRSYIETGRYVHLLNALTPHIDQWFEKYGDLFKESSVVPGLLQEELPLFFEHLKLFVFSMALMPVDRAPSLNTLANFNSSAPFMRKAITASKNVLEIFKSLSSKVSLRFIATSWCTRVVHATTFLLKALVFSAPLFQDKYTHDYSIQLIKDVSALIVTLGPDEHHLTRYFGGIIYKIVHGPGENTGASHTPVENTDSTNASTNDTNHNVASMTIPNVDHSNVKQEVQLRDSMPHPAPGRPPCEVPPVAALPVPPTNAPPHVAPAAAAVAAARAHATEIPNGYMHHPNFNLAYPPPDHSEAYPLTFGLDQDLQDILTETSVNGDYFTFT